MTTDKKSMEITMTCKIDSFETVLQDLVEAGMTSEELADFILDDKRWFREGIEKETLEQLRDMLRA